MNDPTSPTIAPRAREILRVRAHLERAERVLLERAPAGLTPAQRARRGAVLAHLRRYIHAGRYPVNDVAERATPVFVDARGARCAVAALLDATGESALVARVARTANLAYVNDLAGDADFTRWLSHHGLSLEEAARVQPAYHAMEEVRWQPTVSVVTSVHVGGDTALGPQVALAPSLRVGVRRVVRAQDDGGSMRYGSLALAAEYGRSFVVGVGGTNHLGLLLQWEITDSNSDAQTYLLGGPLLSIAEGEAPAVAAGGQLGFGFSFRTRSYPLLFELVAQTLAHGAGVAVRGGLQVGMVF